MRHILLADDTMAFPRHSGCNTTQETTAMKLEKRKLIQFLVCFLIMTGIVLFLAFFVYIPQTSARSLAQQLKGSSVGLTYGADYYSNMSAETSEDITDPFIPVTPTAHTELVNPFIDFSAPTYSKIHFGRYEQADDGGEPEPISWIVLDVEEDRMLLLSECGLDCLPITNMDSQWVNSSWRTWLNSEFLQTAFSEEELRFLSSSPVNASVNDQYPGVDPGPDTVDAVFVLSAQECEQYLNTKELRLCSVTPYAVRRGAVQNEVNGTAVWALRTPGSFLSSWVLCDFYSGTVNYGGGLCGPAGSGEDGKCLRPVLWVQRTVTDKQSSDLA